MKQFVIKNSSILFYSFWFSSLLIQAFFTELTFDESYYWMYSKELAWGYFDHPPAIALMIKIGYSIFKNELGVRLLPIFASTLTLFLWEKIMKPKNLKVFYLLILSVGILHFIGFFALPDNPLLLATAFYFLCLKQFLVTANLKNGLLLGFASSLLILSKYHGILILVFTLLPNLSLLKKKSFWFVVFSFVLFLIPHILWQIHNDFPSVKYHLFERSVASYKINFTLEYLLTQPFILGPFTGILFFIAHIKIKSKDSFEKSLKYLFWGGYFFFFLMSFKGRVEAHWTLFVVFSGLYFGYEYIAEITKKKKIIYKLFYISIALIFLVRILISLDVENKYNTVLAKITKQFHQKESMLAIKKEAKDLPVAFMNSYQKASLYSFYTQATSFSLNNIWGRKNQFDIWNYEQRLRGEKIFLIPNYKTTGYDSILAFPKIKYKTISNFQSYSKIKIIPNNIIEKANSLDTISVKIRFSNIQKEFIDLEKNKKYPAVLYYQFIEGKYPIKTNIVKKLTNKDLEKELELNVVTPNKKGVYRLCFSIMSGDLPHSINSEKYKIEIR
ncbi:ArnT family glycosyltransferase [Polaribacter cellanae]|uniref:Glycosyltransferase family 39 protein n=1 Tax=Polaribacter cellanae TaxID=2818493 RepID=A0A975CNS0_9FLAO|nr:glycosyltransferase family 39 protein [Polaribacter cellanae]QTE21935.1 glycosyltransferase family 39 protein [Polaribacter cellanae]